MDGSIHHAHKKSGTATGAVQDEYNVHSFFVRQRQSRFLLRYCYFSWVSGNTRVSDGQVFVSECC